LVPFYEIVRNVFEGASIFVYSKSEYTTKIGQCVRPAVRPSVYSITLHNYIRLS
jgi:hypothetical protein